MRLNRRSLSFSAVLLAMLAVGFAACTDDGASPVVPEPPVVTPPLNPSDMIAVPCQADVRTRQVQCGVPGSNAGGASLAIIGGQNVYVKVTSSNIALEDDPTTVPADSSVFGFDITLQSLLRQPTDGRRQLMGTLDSINSVPTPDPNGIQIFFYSLVGTGDSVAVYDPDGLGTFTEANQPFYRYSTVLDSGQVSGAERWRLKMGPGLTSFNFLLLVSAAVPIPQGWVEVIPDTVRLAVAGKDTLTGTPRGFAGQPQPGKQVFWNSLNNAVATVDSAGIVTAVATGTTIVRATTPTAGQRGDAVVIVSAAPTVQPDTFQAITNVTIPVPKPGLKQKIVDPDGDARIVGGTFATAQGGTVTVDSAGSFRYLSKPGFSGQDSFTYTVTDGVTTLTPTAIVQVAASNYWFVKQGGAGFGTDAAPFGTVALAQDSAGVGDTIFVLHSATPLEGPAVLENGQGLVGQGIAVGISRTLNDSTFFVLSAGAQPQLTRTSGNTVTLAQNNTVAGVAITSGLGAAIAGSSFGTLTVAQTSVNPRGPALDLTGGAIAGAGFLLLSSTDSDSAGLVLNNVTGTLLASGGTISNATGSGVRITGGTVDLSYPGSIGSTGPGAAISGRTGGALAFAGNVTAGGGITVTGNSSGTVTFGGPLALTTRGISVTGNTGGTIAFVDSTGSKTISTGANAGVTLATNTGATVRFAGGNLAITTTTGAGFTASGGGIVTVTGAGNTVTTTTGIPVSLDGINTTGAVGAGITFVSVNSNGAANGIKLNALTGAGFQVTGIGSPAATGSGGTIASPTGHGIHLTNLAATPVVLTELAVSGAGAGGNAGVLTFDVDSLVATALSIAANGGPALSLEGTTLYGSFARLVSTNSASSGLILNTVNGAAAALAPLDSITGAAGTTIAVIGGSVDLLYAGKVAQANNQILLSVTNGHTGDLNFQGTVQATNGTGLQFANADGTYAFNGTTTMNGGNAGIDVTTGSDGVFTFGAATSVTGPSGGPALDVNGGTPAVVYQGTLTHNTGRAVSVQNITADSVAITGSITSGAPSGTGILVNGNSGTSKIVFDGASKSLTTGANPAVTLTSNTGATIRFGGGGLAITTTTGAGFSATGGGTVTVTGAGNTIAATGGTAVNIQNTTIGVDSATFQSVSATGGTSGIVLNTTGAGVFRVTGTGAAATGGTITGTTGPGVSLTSTTTVRLNNMSLNPGTGAANAAISGNNFGTLTVNGTAVTAGAGPALLLTTGTLNGTFSSVGGTIPAASVIQGVALASVGGSFTVSGGTLTGGNDSVAVVRGGTVSATWSGGITQANNAPLLAVVGGHQTGTLAFGGTLAATNGTGLQFDNADGTYNFTGTVTLNGGNAGIDVLNNSGGTFSFSPAVGQTQSINNPSGELIQVASSSPTFTYAGSFTKTNAGVGILVQSSGGTISFTGDGTTLDSDVADVTKTLTTTTGNAVNLLTNTGTVNFQGGGLAITTTTGTGFNATGGGTVNVTGAGNTVTSGTGAAVNIQNTTVGASGVVFRQVNASGGTVGIVLENTGNTGGGFGVTGDGSTAGSGGTIQNASQDGVRLNNTRNISLGFMTIDGGSTVVGASCGTLSASDCSGGVTAVTVTALTLNRMVISNSAQMGISGQGVNGLTVTDTRILSAGDGNDEFGMVFHELTGTVLIEDTRIDGAEDSGMWLRNTTGTLNLTLNRDTITENGINAALNVGEHGTVFEIDGTAVASILVQNSEYFNLDRGAILAQAEGTGAGSTLNLTVQNNNLHDIGSFGVEALANYTSALNVNVANNTIHNWVTNGVNILGAVNSNVTARVTGNTLTNPRVDDVANGIRVVQEEDSDMTTLVQNNNISGQSFTGIIGFSRLGDLNTSAGTGAAYGTHHLTVRGNTVGAPTAVNGGYGIDLQSQNEENDMCLDIGFSGSAANNVSAGTGGGVTGIRVRKSNTSSGAGTNAPLFKIEGMALGAQSIATTVTHVQTYNPGTTAFAATTPAGGTFDGVAANSCRDAGTVPLP